VKRALVVGLATALALAVACQVPDRHFRVGDAGGDAASDTILDAIDAPSGPCNLAAPWGPLAPVPGLGSLRSVARFTPDELTAYFALGSDGTQPTLPDTLFVATRSGLGSSFASATKLTGVNGSDGMSTPSISADGMALFYVWGEAPLHMTGSDRDIYAAQRIGSNFQFGSGSNLTTNLAGVEDDYPYVSSDGDVWFASQRGSDQVNSIYKANSAGGFAQFSGVSRASNLNSTTAANIYPTVSADLLDVYFERGSAVYVGTRGSAGDSFNTPFSVNEINNDTHCMGTACRPAWISPDGCRLYIGAGASGSAITMYVSSKPAN
jgi:hypothetical protein